MLSQDRGLLIATVIRAANAEMPTARLTRRPDRIPGIAPGKNVVEVENKLMKCVPKDYLLDAHHWLILHGRYVCVARKPRCGSCRIEDLCEFKQKTSDD